MNKLRETFDAGKPNIISERKRPDGNTMSIVVPWIQADKKNANGRTYPLALLQREVSRIQGAVKKGSLVGTGDHPIGGLADIATASHILQKVWLDDKGKGFAEMKIIPSERGKSIQTLIQHGAELGVSSRGFGNVSDTGIVQNDYKLTGIDIVMNPSYKEGVFSKNDVFESMDFETEKDDKDKDMKNMMMGLSEDYVETMIESVYGLHINEGIFSGSLEDFKKKKEAIIRAEILVAHDHFETTEEALKHLGAGEEARRISSAAPVQQRVKLADVYYEAQAAGIDPQTYCDRINANIDRQEALESEPDFTVQEVASILEEGRKAGIDITDPEERKRILNIAREQRKQPEALTEEENFIRFAVNKGLNERTAKLLWSKIQKEKKQITKAQSFVDEKIAAGFGSETRPDARKRSKKIILGD